jgi:hypothetical protein
MAKLSLNKIGRPEGTLIRVGNLGLFANGQVHEISGEKDITIGPPLPSSPVGQEPTAVSAPETDEE